MNNYTHPLHKGVYFFEWLVAGGHKPNLQKTNHLEFFSSDNILLNPFLAIPKHPIVRRFAKERGEPTFKPSYIAENFLLLATFLSIRPIFPKTKLHGVARG